VWAVIVFGIFLLVCAVEVIHLARDARADMDSERPTDVFTRRWRAARSVLRRGQRLLDSKPKERRLMNRPTVQIPKPKSTTTLTRG
jgi:hypothetical protein